jgi:hypothetical protein
MVDPRLVCNSRKANFLKKIALKNYILKKEKRLLFLIIRNFLDKNVNEIYKNPHIIRLNPSILDFKEDGVRIFFVSEHMLHF